jgi:hypothetical membrane protein
MLFNVTLLLVGTLNGVGAWLVHRVDGRRTPLALAAITGAGAIGAALFPLDTGGIHGVSALLAFLALNLQALAVATGVHGPMRGASILAGVTGLVFVGLMIVGDAGNAAAFGPIGHGGTERMIVYPAMLWMLVYGGWLMAGGGDPAGSGS